MNAPDFSSQDSESTRRHLQRNTGAASSLHWLAFLLLFFAITLTSLYWWRLSLGEAQLRADTLEQATKRATQLAELQARHIGALYLGIDIALRQYRDAIQIGDETGAAAIARSTLRAFPSHSLVQIASSDARGNLTYSTLSLTESVHIADREYFKFHQSSHQDRLYINKPLIGKLAHSWEILNSRPISKNGQFAGIVYIALSPFYLSDMLAKLRMESGDIAELVYSDGTYMGRSSGLNELIGKTVPQDRPYLAEKSATHGSFRTTGVPDGVPRIFGWYKLDGYPMVIEMGLDEAAILAPVEIQIKLSRQRSAIAIGLLLLLVSLISYLLIRAGRQQATLEKNEAMLRSTLEATEAGILVVDGDGLIVEANRRFYEIWRAPEELHSTRQDEDMLAYAMNQVSDPDEFLHKVMAIYPTDREDTSVVNCKDGRVLERHTRSFYQGSKHLRFWAFRDITALKQAEATQDKLNRALRLLSDCNMTLVRAEDEYKLLVEICHVVVERGGYVMAWIGYAEQDAGKSVRPITQCGFDLNYLDTARITWADTERGQGVTGTAIRTGMTSVNQNFMTEARMTPWREAAITHGYKSSIALPLIGTSNLRGALTMYSRDADAFNLEEVKLLEEMAGDLTYGIEVLRTRAEHASAKEKVAFLAHFDPLTHLPNRLLLRDRFEHAAIVADGKNKTVAILYLDLDNFRHINEAMGMEVGDRLLIAFANRLQQCISITDTISRMSGDEFVVLLVDVHDATAVANVAGNILDAFIEPLIIDANPVSISSSMGISLFPHDGNSFDDLLQQANTAVNHAKESGGNTYHFFTQEMNKNALEQTQLKGQLHNALKNQQFLLHYQPQIDLHSGRIVGAEALVRWQHPLHGLIPPVKFIPLAEQSGHIIQIGEWVLNEACRQARLWLDQGNGKLAIAVNFSALQFKRGNILEVVSAALANSGLPPECLELELTESILLQDVDATMQTLRSLKAMGVKLSIDDFGTGYSSLSYLKQLAVDKLKIDQSFVNNMLAAPDDAAIIKAIIQLGHILQLIVIAEGVETDAQLAFLVEAGCDEVQGYLYSRPVSAEEFAQLLEKN